jgi:hypothetical protein
MIWGAIVAGLMLVGLIFLIIALARGAEHAVPEKQALPVQPGMPQQ